MVQISRQEIEFANNANLNIKKKYKNSELVFSNFQPLFWSNLWTTITPSTMHPLPGPE